MNFNRSRTPPDNAKILPDMYNILDAHTLKKTATINGMLKYQLTTKQSVISKHQYHAQRIIKEEKARVTKSLNHIRTKLPAVTRIRDFDMKFFGNTKPQIDDSSDKKMAKGYQSSKNDEAICHRCYIHHLPLKKRFYTRSLPPLSKNRPFLQQKSTTNDQSTDNGNDENEHESEAKERLFDEVGDQTNHFLSRPTDNKPEQDRPGRRGSLSQSGKHSLGWWMPASKTYQFLKKDIAGRDLDVNKHFTPRLMPYEDWKNVVSDVCSHYHKNVDGLRTIYHDPHNTTRQTNCDNQN